MLLRRLIYVERFHTIQSHRFLFRRCKSSFTILGLDENNGPISYKDAKKAFVKLALKYHPDRTNNNDGSRDFIKIRQAFESIQELPDGSCINNEEGVVWTDQGLSDLLYRESGQSLAFRMDSSTRIEVAKVANSMQQSGLDRGGMWEMARMIANEEAANPSKPEPKQLNEGGTSSTTGRRRKRR
mmetsp:Transcript_37796/g.43176  ORF Transcript_37796/g.43176 Transcript_37796/m.43176 type:complete len:184 (+) Transcript_37796:61-612(+)